MSGWFALERGWRDCAAFEPRRDAMADEDAWLWLLEHTAWKATRRSGGQGQAVALTRGQIHVSDRALASAFMWDKKRVRRFIDRLVEAQMVDQHRDQSGTTLTICNFDKYQRQSDPKGPVKGPPTGPVEDQLRTSSSRSDQTENPGHDSLSGTTHRTKNSSPYGEGVPPVDTVKAIWDIGIALLTASGQTDRAARSIVGRWRKDFGDGPTLEAMLDCQARRISNPVEWMPRRLAAARGHSQAAGPGLSDLTEQASRYGQRRAA